MELLQPVLHGFSGNRYLKKKVMPAVSDIKLHGTGGKKS